MDLSNLQPAVGSTSSRRRIGRGPGSGMGGTSTRGHKGAKQRSGYSRKIGFEGGQTPIFRRLPKVGFNNPSEKIVQSGIVVNRNSASNNYLRLSINFIEPISFLWQKRICGF